jgi:hypothetical protein
MDIGKSFSFVFDDEDWLKLLIIGGLIFLIPIVNFAGLGYLVQVIRNVRDGHERPLPTWDNFGEFFMEGLKVFVGLLVWFSPLIVLACVFGGAMGVMGAAAEEMSSSDVESAMGLLFICFQCGIFIFALLPYLFFPALFGRFAETGEISSMLRFGEIFSFIRQNTTDYIIVLLLSGAVLYFIAPLGLIACFVGVILTQWWGYLVFGHLTGQLLRQGAV